MNFLAHAYLSGEDRLIRIGNFMGDFVKGSNYLQYPEAVQKGILMHRSIDAFTDRHPLVLSGKTRFDAKYHRYSSVLMDLLYDHFLAKDWYNFHSMPLHDYVNEIHNDLLNHFELYPERLKSSLPTFMKHRWIERYVGLEGLRDVCEVMSQTTSLPAETDFAMEVIVQNYETFRNEFYEFFSQIIFYIEDTYMVSIRSQNN